MKSIFPHSTTLKPCPGLIRERSVLKDPNAQQMKLI